MGILEAFTTYTEEDDNNKLTVTASKAEGVDVDQDEDVYLYKDKTVDHFDALDIDFEIYIASTSLDRGVGGMAVTNTIGSLPSFANTDVCSFLYRAPGGIYTLYLYRGYAIASDAYTCNVDTLYYCTLVRAAGNDVATLNIYSDAERADLLDNPFVAGFGTEKWQYIYGFVNRNLASGGRDFDGYVQNLDLNEHPIPVTDGDLIGIGIIRKS